MLAKSNIKTFYTFFCKLAVRRRIRVAVLSVPEMSTNKIRRSPPPRRIRRPTQTILLSIGFSWWISCYFIPEALTLPGGNRAIWAVNWSCDTFGDTYFGAGALGRKWAIQKRLSESTQNFRRSGFSPCPTRCCLLICE